MLYINKHGIVIQNAEQMYYPNGTRMYPDPFPGGRQYGERMNKGTVDVATDKELIGFEPKSPPELRVVTGGKEQPPENWLHGLKVGEVFFCKDKKDTTSAFCQCFEVEAKFEKVVKIIQYLPDEREMKMAVVSLYFSRQFEYVESY